MSTQKVKGIIAEVEFPAETEKGKQCFSELEVIALLNNIELFNNRREISSYGRRHICNRMHYQIKFSRRSAH